MDILCYKAVVVVLVHRLVKEYLDIAFIQEPYLVVNQIKTLTGERIYNTS